MQPLYLCVNCTLDCLDSIVHVIWNARIFREIKSQDRKFPDRILQDGKFWDQKIPGIPIFHGIQEKKIRENSRIFFFRGQKIPGFLAPLNSRIENSVTEFPRTFLPFMGFFGQNKDKTLPFLGLTPESRNGATFLSA